MLPWLQLRPRRKNVFLAKLCIVSGLVHFFLCFGLFFIYKNYIPTAILQVHASGKQHDVIVRLLPLGAKKPISIKTTTAIKQKKTFVAKAPIKKKPVTQFAKVSKKSVVEAKKQDVKLIEHKKSAVIENKKIEVKEPKKKQEQKLVEKKQAIEQAVLTKSDLVKSSSDKQVSILEENVQYVTHKELQGIELEQAVQESVQAVWFPPVGMNQDLVSEVRVVIGWDGSLIESKIVKATNIAIYDVAVQDALAEIKFPRAAWGKEIKIAFKP